MAQHWRPCRPVCDHQLYVADPDRVVLWDDVEPYLFYLYTPRCLTRRSSVPTPSATPCATLRAIHPAPCIALGPNARCPALYHALCDTYPPHQTPCTTPSAVPCAMVRAVALSGLICRSPSFVRLRMYLIFVLLEFMGVSVTYSQRVVTDPLVQFSLSSKVCPVFTWLPGPHKVGPWPHATAGLCCRAALCLCAGHRSRRAWPQMHARTPTPALTLDRPAHPLHDVGSTR